MIYLKVNWIHEFDTEPVWLYSEIDHDRWEIRKVEVFSDGRMCFAEKSQSSGSTKLGEEPLPRLVDIAADPQFVPIVISKEEFEDIWESAK